MSIHDDPQGKILRIESKLVEGIIKKTVTLVKNCKEDGSVKDGVKRTVKNDISEAKQTVKYAVCEKNPIGKIIYKEGRNDGIDEGVIKTSEIYEEKFTEQAKDFSQKEQEFCEIVADYEDTLDAYENKINELIEK